MAGNEMPPNLEGKVLPLQLTLQIRVVPKDFRKEEGRLESFAGFPFGTVDVRQLAKAGFVYTKSGDVVRCVFCGVEVGQWEEGDDPWEEHRKWSENCGFLNHMDVGNVPINPQEPLPPLPPLEDIGHDECGIYNIKKTDSCPVIPSLEKLGICKWCSPAHPNYSTLESRLQSFSSWPVGLKLRPQELTDAGFFYTGLGDKTILFQCGGELKDWEDTDEPFREHALYFSKCGFVIQTKGRDFIADVLGKRPESLTPEEIQALATPNDFTDVVQQHTPLSNDSCSDTSGVVSASSSPVQDKGKKSEAQEDTKEASQPSRKLDNARVCKICFSQEIGVAFLPCGHLVACASCVSSLSTCAVCREPFSATVRVFMS